MMVEHAFIYRGVYSGTGPANFATNTNISYGAIWGNVCNKMGLQPEFATVRNLAESMNLCFSITLFTHRRLTAHKFPCPIFHHKTHETLMVRSYALMP